MNTVPFHLNLPIRESFDIVVCGGGIAGCAAALQAARLGKKVLLLEKSVLLGGLATMGLVNFFVPLCNGRGKQICRGMAEEFLRLSVRYGYDTLPEEWKVGEPSSPTTMRYLTNYDPYIFAMQLTELLTDAGVSILFDCNAAYPMMDGGHCLGVVTDSKSGLEFRPALQFIDATGDADLAQKAGIPTADGKSYFSYFGHAITLDSCRRAAESGRIQEAVVSISGGSANLYGGGHPEDVPFFFGTGAEVVSDYLIRNQRVMLDKLKQDENRFGREVVSVPMMPQFRCIRRIEGDAVLHDTDAYRHFADSVCAINDFDRRDFLYEVPLRSLTRKGFDNLITAGRAASADGYAWDVIRVIPPAILTGQAAAVCASHAIDEGTAISEVNIGAVQSVLEQANVMIHFDDSLIPENPDPAHLHVEKL